MLILKNAIININEPLNYANIFKRTITQYLRLFKKQDDIDIDLLKTKKNRIATIKNNMLFNKQFGSLIKTSNIQIKKLSNVSKKVSVSKPVPNIEQPVKTVYNYTTIKNILINNSSQLAPILRFPLVNSNKEKSEPLPKNVPSVTKVLSATMSPESVAMLEKWKLDMIQIHGEEGFKKLHKLILLRGTTLHQTIAQYAQGDFLLEPPDLIKYHWESLRNSLIHFRDFTIIEKPVAHPFLLYKGIVDTIAYYKDELVLIEWKSSKKLKPSLRSLYDSPIQAAAYLGAINFDPKFEMELKKAILVIAYEDGRPSKMYKLQQSTLKNYWNEWLLRLKKYYELQRPK